MGTSSIPVHEGLLKSNGIGCGRLLYMYLNVESDWFGCGFSCTWVSCSPKLKLYSVQFGAAFGFVRHGVACLPRPGLAKLGPPQLSSAWSGPVRLTAHLGFARLGAGCHSFCCSVNLRPVCTGFYKPIVCRVEIFDYPCNDTTSN